MDCTEHFISRLVRIALIVVATVIPTTSKAQPAESFQAYVSAFNSEDGNGVLDVLHSQSPFFMQSMQQMKQVFPVYDIEITVTEMTMLGSSKGDRFAVIEQHFRKAAGPAYQDNRQRAVVVFRQEDGLWKIWAITPFDGGPI